jgi:hypothetical protein
MFGSAAVRPREDVRREAQKFQPLVFLGCSKTDFRRLHRVQGRCVDGAESFFLG